MVITPEMIALQETQEEAMLEEGRQRYIKRVQDSLKDGAFSTSPAGSRVIGGGIDRVSTKIINWVKDQEKKKEESTQGKRRLPTIFPIIRGDHLRLSPQKKFDPTKPTLSEWFDSLSAIALRVITDMATTKRTYQSVACKIGAGVEDEIRFRSLKEKNPGLYAWALSRGKNQKNHHHKRFIMVWQADRVVELAAWDDEFKLRVGTLLIEMVKRATGIIDIITMPRRNKNDRTWYVVPSHGFLTWVRKFDLDTSISMPVHLPMLIPPRQWTNPFDGGYYSKAMPVIPLVKTRNKKYLDEFQQMNPTAVYQAINNLQAVAWEVNPEVLKVAQQMWGPGQGGRAEMPDRREIPMPSKPLDIAENAVSRKAYSKQVAKVYERRAIVLSRSALTDMVMRMSERFIGKPIYFPYQVDFRGRVYSIAFGLSPQGCGLAKGLLRFSWGKPLSTPEAIEWFYIQGANTAGIDRVSFSDRIKWVNDNAQRILDVARDPMEFNWWTDVDSPWQFLAWCFEFRDWKAQGDKFLSRIPVSLDGSCSGLQHFSAMLRDPVGAEAVNLLPSPEPQDIYGKVAERVRAKLESEFNDTSLFDAVRTEQGQRKREKKGLDNSKNLTVGTMARLWSAYGIDRKITKRPVMTLPYGSTQYSCRDFIREIVREREELGKPHPFGDKLMDALTYLARHVWDAIGQVVTCAPQVMAWLRKSADAAADLGVAISWVTPSGFPVRQVYSVMSSERVRLHIGDETQKITLSHETKELDSRAMTNGISPNFVHSMDASALVMAVNDAQKEGIADVAVVHDSFGTHAADTERFAQIIRKSFVDMYLNHDVLDEFRQAVGAMGVDAGDPPARGTLDLNLTINARYSFA